jgi:hypothetical protein
MSAYVKNGDTIALLLSIAEATALRDLANRKMSGWQNLGTGNNQTLAAQDRAVRALETACERGSRSGARID